MRCRNCGDDTVFGDRFDSVRQLIQWCKDCYKDIQKIRDDRKRSLFVSQIVAEQRQADQHRIATIRHALTRRRQLAKTMDGPETPSA